MMRDYAEYLIAEDDKNGGTHLIFPAFTFGDWLAQDGLTPQSLKGGTEDAFIQGVYFMQSLQLTARAALVLGEEADAARYDELAAACRAALVEEYVTPGGRLALDTQTAYVLALKHDICRDREKLIACFRNRLKKDFYRITCGFTGAPLMLGVLLENGMTDVAFRMLLSEEFPGWLYAVNLGATTIWERWNSLESDGTISGTGMNSLNHYAYGSVCEAVFAHICGLCNAAPGWKRARIAPKLSGRIRHSRIAIDSPAGRWETTWRIADDGSVELRVTVPEGCTATVILPDHPEQQTLLVEAGAHAWHYQPAVDYLHPFSAQSMMMDLLASDEAAALLQQKAPGILGMAAAPDSDFRVESPIGVAFAMPFLNPDDAFALDPLLRGIHI
jgi:alpha-L-rhamnosidase